MPRALLFDGRYRSVVTLPEYRLGMSPANKGKTYPVEILTEAEFDQLLSVISTRGSAGKRNRAAVALMWGCGLRIAEALALEPKDIDLSRGALTVLRGKGSARRRKKKPPAAPGIGATLELKDLDRGKPKAAQQGGKRRTLGIPPGCQAILEVWLEERRRLNVPPGRPVFCVITVPRIGRQLGHAYLREAVKEYGERAGLQKRVHPHGLRHSFAVRQARRGVPMPTLQRMLGHTSLATTQRYLVGLDDADVIDALVADDWGLDARQQLVADVERASRAMHGPAS